MQGEKEPELYEASVSETRPAPERHLLTEEKTEMFPRTRERFQMLLTHTQRLVSFTNLTSPQETWLLWTATEAGIMVLAMCQRRRSPTVRKQRESSLLLLPVLFPGLPAYGVALLTLVGLPSSSSL